ncbi:50s ribosomal protein l1 [Stylonychia lemnae]|uniref:50s ribosomal protein l1 n=1 Tax=Stylonychia lemnae TaxID=5949 RepID=A0A078A5Y0_STYLE|nr:50s ribosomal protein l1 [Stylonychia lemnae]|eukprot:CDW76960.1 50s ribosomal protein l1 [Stylonychia lemnae]
MRSIARLQGRINKRLRKYRQDRITNESSFNKNEILAQFYQKKATPLAQANEAAETGVPSSISAGIINLKKELTPKEALQQVKTISKERKFKESVEAIIRLAVDPKQGTQNIRGTCILPAGTGKTAKICVFADKSLERQVVEAGADIFGNDEVLRQISEGKLDFDKLIATQEQMGVLRSFAKILGPKGLMPNLKSGTLVKPDALIETIKISKQGQIEFRVNEYADIMVKIGLREFETDSLFQNFDAFAKALASKKPESIKGKYFVRGYVKSSMGPTVKVDLSEYQRMLQD